MTVHQANPGTPSPPRRLKVGVETGVALAGTAFSAILLVSTAIYAGPLWRDEVNTINVAQMPSLKELWGVMPFESFPPLWPLLLRGCSLVGLAGSDESIRLLGLYIGVFFLASLWLCSRWIAGRAPIMSVALLGSLPAFIFIVGANRAYGLASCLLVLCFGTIWRMVEFPSRGRVLLAGFICFLFAHCVYYDLVFLCAMLSGGAMVAIRRRHWKTLGALAGIGAVSGGSMAIYLPIIHQGSAYVPMVQWSFFDFSLLWYKLGDAVSARSSGILFSGPNGLEIWLWIGLMFSGLVVALVMQLARKRPALEQGVVAATGVRADLALFCAVSMLFGVLGYSAFLFRLHYLTETWYYIEMLSLCAISIDGLLGANWPALRPWGLIRIGFIVAVMAWYAPSAVKEAHTRRSNVDLIADVLEQRAAGGDLIVVQGAWEGITFNRYYHGQAHWVTVPPIDSHQVHRTDLVLEKMKQRDPMAPVLLEITNVLRSGNSVWMVGQMTAVPRDRLSPPPPPPGLPTGWWLRPYMDYWNTQVTACLLGHAQQSHIIEMPLNMPVTYLENLPVAQFSGYKTDAD